ncbi:MAG: antibiotic biosynthesis monooxygenase family protein [Dehalococcoidia bacterium]
MFVQHVEFEVVPEKRAHWEPYVRNYLAVQARQPGGVSFRILRLLDEPNKFISLRTWLSREDARRAGESPEAQLAGRPALEGGFYQDRPARWTEHELLDMVWGRAGPDPFGTPGRYVHHIAGAVASGKLDEWRVYSRTFVAVMARQPGLVSHETLRSSADAQRFIALRTHMSQADARIGPEFEPPAEVKLAAAPARSLHVYEGSPPSVARPCEVYDVVWGVAGPWAYDQFMANLEPV